MLNPCRNHRRMLNSGLVLLQKLTRLAYLYLGDNELTAVPHLPESLYVVHLHVSSSVIYFEKTNKKNCRRNEICFLSGSCSQGCVLELISCRTTTSQQ